MKEVKKKPDSSYQKKGTSGHQQKINQSEFDQIIQITTLPYNQKAR